MVAHGGEDHAKYGVESSFEREPTGTCHAQEKKRVEPERRSAFTIRESTQTQFEHGMDMIRGQRWAAPNSIKRAQKYCVNQSDPRRPRLYIGENGLG
jgi:hypothetical protein